MSNVPKYLHPLFFSTPPQTLFFEEPNEGYDRLGKY